MKGRRTSASLRCVKHNLYITLYGLLLRYRMYGSEPFIKIHGNATRLRKREPIWCGGNPNVMYVLPWFQDCCPPQASRDVFVDGELPVDLRQVQAGPLRVALQCQPGRVRPVGEQRRHRARYRLTVEEAARQRPLLQEYRGNTIPAAGKKKSFKFVLSTRANGMIA